MVKLDDLYTVYFLARKNKRRSKDAIKFEINYEKNLYNLYKTINDRTYTPTSNYAFVLTKPKPREVFGCELEARLLQWYIIWRIGDILENILTPRTFNNRVDKGVDAAIAAVRKDIREVTNNYTQDAYIILWDLKGYFPNANRKIIKQQMQQLVNTYYFGEDKDDILWMIDVVISTDPQNSCYRKSSLKMWDLIENDKSLFCKPSGIGAAIGFLIFLVAMNLYLNTVDHWALDEMKLNYTRFVDDTVIVVKDKQKALLLLPIIRKMYDNVGAYMHPKKFYCLHYTKGLKFLGSYIKFDRQYLANRTIRNARTRVNLFNHDKNKRKHIDLFLSSFNSYTGLMKHKTEFKNMCKLYNNISDKWKKYFCFDNDRKCLVSKKNYKHTENIKYKFLKIT